MTLLHGSFHHLSSSPTLLSQNFYILLRGIQLELPTVPGNIQGKPAAFHRLALCAQGFGFGQRPCR